MGEARRVRKSPDTPAADTPGVLPVATLPQLQPAPQSPSLVACPADEQTGAVAQAQASVLLAPPVEAILGSSSMASMRFNSSASHTPATPASLSATGSDVFPAPGTPSASVPVLPSVAEDASDDASRITAQTRATISRVTAELDASLAASAGAAASAPTSPDLETLSSTDSMNGAPLLDPSVFAASTVPSRATSPGLRLPPVPLALRNPPPPPTSSFTSSRSRSGTLTSRSGAPSALSVADVDADRRSGSVSGDAASSSVTGVASAPGSGDGSDGGSVGSGGEHIADDLLQPGDSPLGSPRAPLDARIDAKEQLDLDILHSRRPSLEEPLALLAPSTPSFNTRAGPSRSGAGGAAYQPSRSGSRRSSSVSGKGAGSSGGGDRATVRALAGLEHPHAFRRCMHGFAPQQQLAGGTGINLMHRMTLQLEATLRRCNPALPYRRQLNPRRALTTPSKGVQNNGNDNEHGDYILYVGEVIRGNDRRYVVEDMLGSGTFGQVVRCHVQGEPGRKLAVKVIKNKPAYTNQALEEIRVLQWLNNRFDPDNTFGLVRLEEHFICHKHLCLVFEVLSVNLYDVIKANAFTGLSLTLIRVVLQQILRALCVLSDARVVHCDLKPENILLQRPDRETVKLIDFGSACFEQRTVYTYIQSRFYRSPEVLLGLSYSASIDVWSLGCIAAEMLLGLPLFPGVSEYDQLSRIITMCGTPTQEMLLRGKFVHKFFDSRTDNVSGRLRFVFKQFPQYAEENHIDLLTHKDNYHFKFDKLPELIANLPLPPGAEAKAELEARRSFCHLLQGLLQIDPSVRWTPAQAQMHPFLTGEAFTGTWQPESRHAAAARSFQQRLQVYQRGRSQNEYMIPELRGWTPDAMSRAYAGAVPFDPRQQQQQPQPAPDLVHAAAMHRAQQQQQQQQQQPLSPMSAPIAMHPQAAVAAAAAAAAVQGQQEAMRRLSISHGMLGAPPLHVPPPLSMAHPPAHSMDPAMLFSYTGVVSPPPAGTPLAMMQQQQQPQLHHPGPGHPQPDTGAVHAHAPPRRNSLMPVPFFMPGSSAPPHAGVLGAAHVAGATPMALGQSPSMPHPWQTGPPVARRHARSRSFGKADAATPPTPVRSDSSTSPAESPQPRARDIRTRARSSTFTAGVRPKWLTDSSPANRALSPDVLEQNTARSQARSGGGHTASGVGGSGSGDGSDGSGGSGGSATVVSHASLATTLSPRSGMSPPQQAPVGLASPRQAYGGYASMRRMSQGSLLPAPQQYPPGGWAVFDAAGNPAPLQQLVPQAHQPPAQMIGMSPSQAASTPPMHRGVSHRRHRSLGSNNSSGGGGSGNSGGGGGGGAATSPFAQSSLPATAVYPLPGQGVPGSMMYQQQQQQQQQVPSPMMHPPAPPPRFASRGLQQHQQHQQQQPQ